MDILIYEMDKYFGSVLWKKSWNKWKKNSIHLKFMNWFCCYTSTCRYRTYLSIRTNSFLPLQNRVLWRHGEGGGQSCGWFLQNHVGASSHRPQEPADRRHADSVWRVQSPHSSDTFQNVLVWLVPTGLIYHGHVSDVGCISIVYALLKF